MLSAISMTKSAKYVDTPTTNAIMSAVGPWGGAIKVPVTSGDQFNN